MAADELRTLLAALDDRELVLGLALVPVGTLIDTGRCHVHDFCQEVSRYAHLRPDQLAAVQAIFDWHNIRTSDHLPDEGYFRCLAIYGAAAAYILAEASLAALGEHGEQT